MSEYEKLTLKYQFWKDLAVLLAIVGTCELSIIVILVVFFKGVL
jgi:hypothetical protein